jgi:poly(3-hydroxybutyrate) depolymerase
MPFVRAVFLAMPFLSVSPAHAQNQRLAALAGRAQAERTGINGDDGTARPVESITFDGRVIDLYVPTALPPSGARSLLVVLHGGMGNSAGVRRSLSMDGMADKYGFLIAYLNGTPSRASEGMKIWNAGECCGRAQRENVDDVGYITAAIHLLGQKYDVDPNRVYGLGHSNGAMMTQRVMCETGIYQAAVSIAGPLELETRSCPAARGKRIMAIHGTSDQNVPIAGGHGKGIAGVAYRSEDETRRIFEQSGAFYRLLAVEGASHESASIRDAIARSGGLMSEEIVHFLGLAEAN